MDALRGGLGVVTGFLVTDGLGLRLGDAAGFLLGHLGVDGDGLALSRVTKSCTALYVRSTAMRSSCAAEA